MNRVIYLLQSGHLQDKAELVGESPEVIRYLKERKKYSLVSSVLYRNTVPDGQETRQLVLPEHFKDISLNMYTMMLVMRDVIERYHWCVQGSTGLA